MAHHNLPRGLVAPGTSGAQNVPTHTGGMWNPLMDWNAMKEKAAEEARSAWQEYFLACQKQSGQQEAPQIQAPIIQQPQPHAVAAINNVNKYEEKFKQNRKKHQQRTTVDQMRRVNQVQDLSQQRPQQQQQVQQQQQEPWRNKPEQQQQLQQQQQQQQQQQPVDLGQEQKVEVVGKDGNKKVMISEHLFLDSLHRNAPRRRDEGQICPHCKFTFTRRDTLRHHLKMQTCLKPKVPKPKHRTNILYHVCICNKRFTTQEMAHSHMRQCKEALKIQALQQ